MPYVDRDLGHHWLRLWLDAVNVDSSSSAILVVQFRWIFVRYYLGKIVRYYLGKLYEEVDIALDGGFKVI